MHCKRQKKKNVIILAMITAMCDSAHINTSISLWITGLYNMPFYIRLIFLLSVILYLSSAADCYVLLLYHRSVQEQ